MHIILDAHSTHIFTLLACAAATIECVQFRPSKWIYVIVIELRRGILYPSLLRVRECES